MYIGTGITLRNLIRGSSGVSDPTTGFKQIADFTATGAEVSLTVPTDSDTELEYIIDIRNLGAGIRLEFNNDTGSNYGYQYIFNNAGTISSARGVSANITIGTDGTGLRRFNVIAPVGFIKTLFSDTCSWSSGTTIQYKDNVGWSWNNTASITAMKFYINGANFTTGTRITVYARIV